MGLGGKGNGVTGLRDIWRLATERLEKSGVEEAAADAELLLLHLLGKSKAELLRDWSETWDEARYGAAWEAMLRRRESGEPVQYVTGEQFFFGRRFEVTPAVLIPRPETELLAEAVLAAGDRLWPGGAPSVLDVGTGSGALAVTMAAERPAWRVTASDLSPDALEVARRNAALHHVEARMRFVQGNLLKPFLALHGDSGMFVDVLVSNPPYIRSADMEGLQREVRDYEPHLALDGGGDGLDPYRRMAEQLRLLRELPRVVAFEVGAGQAEDVAHLLGDAAGWNEIAFVVDYAGIKRHVVAVR